MGCSSGPSKQGLKWDFGDGLFPPAGKQDLIASGIQNPWDALGGQLLKLSSKVKWEG